MRRQGKMQDVSPKKTKKIINDRLSNLPEALQVHILSFLDTKQAIQTSLLSKQWVNLWTLLSDFRFISSDFDSRSFDGTIEKLLSLRNDSVMINSFALSRNLYGKDLERVLDFVSSQRVQKLTSFSCFAMDYANHWSMNDRLCSFDFLRCLKLESVIVHHLLGLKQVDTLDFERVNLNNSEDFSGCPNLESLTLKDCECGDRNDLVVVAPKLSRLNISYRYYWSNTKFVLSTPRLTFFESSGNGPVSVQTCDMPLLQTIDMDFSGFPDWDSTSKLTWTQKLIAVLKGFPAAKVLRLSSSILEDTDLDKVLKDFHTCDHSCKRKEGTEKDKKACNSVEKFKKRREQFFKEEAEREQAERENKNVAGYDSLVPTVDSNTIRAISKSPKKKRGRPKGIKNKKNNNIGEKDKQKSNKGFEEDDSESGTDDDLNDGTELINELGLTMDSTKVSKYAKFIEATHKP